MFKPAKDRVDYGEELNPPLGYTLTNAVGCTYSLDLTTLITVPISLSQGSEMECNCEKGKLRLLDGIIKTLDKIHIYCQKGKIALPDNSLKLYSFLEDTINQVLPEGRSSFHPKLWVVRYDSKVKGEPSIYKVLVLSRNLTKDRSYDISMAIDGMVTKKRNRNNDKLCNYISHLNSLGEFKNSKRFISDLSKVEFDLEGSIFEEVEFIPMVNGDYESNILRKSCERILIISPFLTEGILKDFHKISSKGKPYLFSRKNELSKISKEVLKGYNCYNIKDEVTDGESKLDNEEGEKISLQDLHGKVYIKDFGKYLEIYLGSANCSYSAFNKNTEFLVKLKVNSKDFAIEDAYEELINEEGKYSLFEEFNGESYLEGDIEDDINEILNKYEKFICNLEIDGLVKSTNNGKYNISLDIKNDLSEILNEKNLEVFIRPLTLRNINMNLKASIKFEDINSKDITSFMVISLKYLGEERSFVLKVPLSDIPQERNNEIIKGIIGNKKAFLNYISYLLGDNSIIELETLLSEDEDEEEGKKDSPGSGGHSFIKRAMYEKLLKASSRDVGKIEEVNGVLEFLGDDIIVPEDFKEVFSNFKGFIKRGN